MHEVSGNYINIVVTLHVSVWVEIYPSVMIRKKCPMSRSTWACELKYLTFDDGKLLTMSRSTWACELKLQGHATASLCVSSRSTWACELKYQIIYIWNNHCQSRSTWACELKWRVYMCVCIYVWSRSTWACELKLNHLKKCNGDCSHAPRERVSWNVDDSSINAYTDRSRSTWACELKCFCFFVLSCCLMSRSTWACELKFITVSIV